jgi:hypothetical protein
MVTAITVGFARGAAARLASFVRRLPGARFARMAEIVAARIQLGIGGVALMVLAEFVGELVPRRR